MARVPRSSKRSRFNDCEVYYICLNKSHPYHYRVMKSLQELCQYCKQPGPIKYYYIGLKNRVVNWASNRVMCKKIAAHWSDRANWIGEENRIGWGRDVKKDVWDGFRFSELSYVWDPNKVCSTWVSLLDIGYYVVLCCSHGCFR